MCAAALLAAAGCGGGGGQTASTTSATTTAAIADRGTWPQDLRRELVKGCETTYSQSKCECATDKLEEHSSPHEAQEIAAEVYGGKSVIEATSHIKIGSLSYEKGVVAAVMQC